MDPVIVDFSSYGISAKLGVADTTLFSLGNSLVDGFQSHGCVYLKNTGIDLDKVARALDFCDQFFALPHETKHGYRMGRTLPHWNGYTGMLTEWAGRKELPRAHKEAYNITLLNEKSVNLSELHPDKEVPGFSEALLAAGSPFLILARHVVECIALATGMKRDAFDHCLRSLDDKGSTPNSSRMKLAWHPPIDDSQDLSKMARCASHTDTSIITFDVLDDTGGFQVQQKDGSWIDVPHIPETIVLFPSRFLETLLSGKISATEHQVLVTDRQMARRERRAFVVQLYGDTGTIKPLDDTTGYTPKPGYDKEYMWLEYMKLEA